jgi:hypothetical protein
MSNEGSQMKIIELDTFYSQKRLHLWGWFEQFEWEDDVAMSGGLFVEMKERRRTADNNDSNQLI